MEKYISFEELAQIIIIDKIRYEIRQSGNQKIYECIERTNNPVQRARYRKFFITSGGVIPDKELKEVD